MNIYSAYIVDDEPLAIRALRKKLEDFPEVEIVGESTRMVKAKAEIEHSDPDILFLDIQLVEGTGFDLLHNLKFTGRVIFISAYDEYALRAFEINALDYILKPVSYERLKTALEKVRSNFQKRIDEKVNYRISDRILVDKRSSMKFILISTIEIIIAAKDYSTVKTSDGENLLMLRSMKSWEEKLPPGNFVRIHRSYIVNICIIERMVRTSTSSAQVYLKSLPEPITLSRTYFKKVKLRFF